MELAWNGPRKVPFHATVDQVRILVTSEQHAILPVRGSEIGAAWTVTCHGELVSAQRREGASVAFGQQVGTSRMGGCPCRFRAFLVLQSGRSARG